MAVCRREIERALSGLLKYAYTLSRDSEAAGELVDMAGFSYAEASATLGIPKGTVMSRLSRARRAMLVEIGGGKVHSLDTA